MDKIKSWKIWEFSHLQLSFQCIFLVHSNTPKNGSTRVWILIVDSTLWIKPKAFRTQKSMGFSLFGSSSSITVFNFLLIGTFCWILGSITVCRTFGMMISLCFFLPVIPISLFFYECWFTIGYRTFDFFDAVFM